MLSLCGVTIALVSLCSGQRYEQYDPIYPQYEYKPYTDDCNREYFPEYAEYIIRFREEWSDRETYPTYRMNQEQQKEW